MTGREVLEALAAEFGYWDHQWRELKTKNGVKEVPGVGHRVMRKRLDDVLGLDWSMEILEQSGTNDQAMARVRIIITADDGHGFREGAGSAVREFPADTADKLLKCAVASAFRSACKQFGICSYLDDQRVVKRLLAEREEKRRQYEQRRAGANVTQFPRASGNQ